MLTEHQGEGAREASMGPILGQLRLGAEEGKGRQTKASKTLPGGPAHHPCL